MEEFKEAVKDAVDPASLLEFLGFDIKIRHSHELRAPCAIHGGDNPTAFRMKLDTKRFSCYSHKCEFTGGQVDNDVFALVMKVKGIGFKQAVAFLAEFVGITETDGSMKEAREKYARKKHISESVREVSRLNKKPLPDIGQEVVDEFVSRECSYFTSIGVSPAAQRFFELGSMVDSFGVERATIPIRDQDGRLVSVSARRTDCNKDPRYLLLKDFKKHSIVYNLNNAILVGPAFDDCVIVVEGFKAAWAVHEAGFINVVAAMGSVVLEPQAMLLANAGFTKCILMLDGDEAGNKGVEYSFPVVSKYMRSLSVPLYDEFFGMSPDDFLPAVLGSIIEESVSELVGR